MANIRSSAKRARQSTRRTLRNRSTITRLRSMQRKTRGASQSDRQQIYALISAIDKAAKRGIIHRNTANRRKSRLNKMLAGGGKK
jgi:small subunit ribosomal protein S20